MCPFCWHFWERRGVEFFWALFLQQHRWQLEINSVFMAEMSARHDHKQALLEVAKYWAKGWGCKTTWREVAVAPHSLCAFNPHCSCMEVIITATSTARIESNPNSWSAPSSDLSPLSFCQWLECLCEMNKKNMFFKKNPEVLTLLQSWEFNIQLRMISPTVQSNWPAGEKFRLSSQCRELTYLSDTWDEKVVVHGDFFSLSHLVLRCLLHLLLNH